MITGRWRHPERLSDRARAWLMCWIAISCALIFLAVWSTYAATHVYPRFEQQRPGEPVTVDGISYRLLRLTRADEVADGDEIRPASAHTVWVIAELELTIPGRRDSMGCDLRLLAAGKRAWDAEGFYNRRVPNYCGDTDHPIRPRMPWRLEQIYQVPTKYADQIEGVAVTDHSSAAPTKVLQP